MVRPANHRYQYTDSGFAEIEQERVGLRRAQAGPWSVDSTAAVINYWTTDRMRVRSLLLYNRKPTSSKGLSKKLLGYTVVWALNSLMYLYHYGEDGVV